MLTPIVEKLRRFLKNILSQSKLGKLIFYHLIALRDWLRFKAIKPTLALEKDETGIIIAYGLGDAYFTCCWLAAFRKFYQTKIVIFADERYLNLLDLFKDHIDRIVVLDQSNSARKLLGATNLRVLTHPFYAFCQYEKNHFFVGHAVALLYQDGSWILPKEHFSQTQRRALGLPIDSKECRPKIKDKHKQLAERIIEQENIVSGRTVLLFPGALSIKTLPHKIWDLICQRLTDNGWHVCINEHSSYRGYGENISKVDFPIEAAQLIAEECGWFISERSGICDVLERARCRKTILLNQEKQAFQYRYQMGRKFIFLEYNLRPTFSLQGRSSNVQEVLIHPENSEEGLSEIDFSYHENI